MPSFNSAFLAVETIINAPPERVREVLLDFDDWPNWKVDQKLVHALYLEDGDGKIVPGIEAKPGDLAKINSVQAGDVVAKVFVNSASKFGYGGEGMGIRGRHYWEFLPLPGEPHKTLLKHCEDFQGGPSFMFWSYSPVRWWIGGLFQAFNTDLKARVEAK